jgi:hypothetical protein
MLLDIKAMGDHMMVDDGGREFKIGVGYRTTEV